MKRIKGSLRVIVEGESIVQGFDVDKRCFPSELRILLKKYSQGYSAVEVMNGGVFGWFSDQLALRAEREFSKLRPDVVVLYCTANDFACSDPFGEKPIDEPFVASLMHHQNLANKYGPFHKLVAEFKNISDKPSSTIAKPAHKTMRRISPERFYSRVFSNVERMVRAYRAQNPSTRVAICTLVGVWPDIQDRYFKTAKTPAGRAFWMATHDLNQHEAADALEQYNCQIRNLARRNGLLLIDADARFSRLDKFNLMEDYFHFNEYGCKILAGLICQELVKNNWIHGYGPTTELEALTAQYRKPAIASTSLVQ